MKEENNDKNKISNNYNLSEINIDNDIEFDISNIENKDGTSSNLSVNKKEKKKLNYSLILKSIINDIEDKRKQRYYDDEYKTNLLLMSELKNIHFKILCLNIILHFNDRKEFSNLMKYILSKIWKYHYTENKIINKKSLIYILTESSRILFQEKNYFYSFYFAWNVKKILNKEVNKKRYKDEIEEVAFLYNQVEESLKKQIKIKYNFIQEQSKNKLEEINKILDDILREAQAKDNEKCKNVEFEVDENNDEEYGFYSFLINKDWIMKAKVFLDYYLISSKESLNGENTLESAFEINNILNLYFNLEKTKSINSYPGPINNFNLIKYKDCWEDSENEDENYYIKNGHKDYIKISEKNYNKLKDVFDSTNDIKILDKNFEYFEMKILILDKKFKEIIKKKLLRLRSMKVRKNMKLINFEKKLIKSVYYEIKKLQRIDDNDSYQYSLEEDFDEINRIMKSSNFSFYLIDKENKNILTEICLSYMNKITSYSSRFITQISFSEEKDTVKTLLSNFDKSKHYLIIEISEKYKDPFLKQLKPDNNSEYTCSLCEKKFLEKDRFFCGICDMSIYCSGICAESCEDHKKLHRKLSQLLDERITLKILKDKILSLEACSNEGRVGLYNLGNTCYINCVVQSLSNTPDLTKYFVFELYKSDINLKYLSFGNDIVENFAEVLKKLWQESSQVASPQKFAINFFALNRQFTPGTEQDAHEFLSCLLSNLHDGLNRVYPVKNSKNKNDKEDEKPKDNNKNNIKENFDEYMNEEKKKNDSFIYDLFTGQFISKTICEECKKEVINFESFNTLSLPIPKKHFSVNIKYFTENGPKVFPVSINDNTRFIDLKEMALFYYENDIIKKVKKYGPSNIYDILNKDANNCIYNYNISKIPKKILFSYIDIVILDKNKSIYCYNPGDNLNILQYLKIKEYDYYEIVFYEKNIVSDKYIHIYVQGSYYSKDKKLLFFKSSEINYSYPVLLSVSKDVALETFEKKIYRRYEQILKKNIYLNLENKDKKKKINLIDIIIPHSKSTSSCPFCNKKYEESDYCYFSDLFEKNHTFLSLFKNHVELNNNDNPIILIANSKYYEVNNKYNYNSNILFIDPDSETKIDKEINLFDCLEKFREEEILDNDDKWLCERCKKKQIARRKIQIYQSPPYLIIQLKRFNYSNNIIVKFFERAKNETQVNFPEVLDLKEYIVGEEKNNAKYELYSFILHDDNHYRTVCKNRGRWILYDDDSLYNFPFKQSKNTYILFYKKIE